MKTAIAPITFALAVAGLAALCGEPTAGFTTVKAREAEKAYLKAMERLKADYDAKVKRAQVDYLKALEGALKEARKSSKADEAALISRTIDELRKKAGDAGEAAKGPQRVEKGPGGVTYIGGNGESIEQAVVIKGAEDSPGAVEAEGHWLRVHYPRFKKTAQGLIERDGRKFDRIEITGPDGTRKHIYFDITECFGFPKDF